jgi:cytochrome c oxidase assembly protein subunit 15
MPSPGAFRSVSRLATATAVLMFGLIVVGSIVRTTGSGLACPDWPLCHGRLIPPFQFNILVEWFHRLLALLVGLLLFTTAGVTLTRGETRGRLGGLAVLGVVLFFVQALLGALTVWKLLDPSVVSGHLAVGLLLFATLVTLAVTAGFEANPGAMAAGPPREPGHLALLAVTTGLTWCQAVLGGMVSTNHASLACPDWPTCNGQWFPPLAGLVGLQMAHRFAGYLLLLVVIAVALRTGRAADAGVRYVGHLLPRLVLLQVALGVVNILMGIPVWVSALHLGNAALMLALGLIATLRLAAQPAREGALAGAPAR